MRLVVVAGLLAAVVAAGPAAAASFDCRKAATPAEKIVCGDLLLSELDGRLGKAYAAVTKAGDFADEAKGTARNFQAVRAKCGSDKGCILAAYVGVLQSLQNLGAPNAAPGSVSAQTIAAGDAPRSGKLPQSIGACVTTTIAGIHPRLGDGSPPKDADYDFGTGVEYDNGGYGVSYEREAALLRSKPGDTVVMCLVSIPHDCPPGDERGRFYLATNQRTGESWTLPDSQHMCGGA
ncbi:lysozyme inhibitor LprI family protein [Jiella sonneratiae]|uniref:Mlr0530 protein n=1 Tax=Jiella sonneratiae TaxID=2816856 RepID=A0ABS3IXZ8_9HYPH|nr:hypothetical protein [Jiella sonneratiae]MBO0902282.1 hypothetical protein [Jiella sonneratiae]